MWLFNEGIFTSADIGDYVGFVYVLTDRVNGKKYAGKKQFFSTKTLPPWKGTSRNANVSLNSTGNPIARHRQSPKR